MSVQQISVFLESRPGHLRRVLDAFEDAHVSVRGYSASDTGDYGIVRFIVDAPDKALAVLQDMGAAATQTDVLCARLDDEPGELARVMGIMADCGINVTYSPSTIRPSNAPRASASAPSSWRSSSRRFAGRTSACPGTVHAWTIRA